MPVDLRIPRKPKLLICPYDPVHRVEEGTRFQSHLIECAKNHPEVQELVCEFNRTHRIKSVDYAFHLLNCPDNYVVRKEFIAVQNEYTMKPQPQPLETYDPVPSSENWEDEALPEPFPIPSISNLNNNKSIKFVNPDQLTGMKPRHKKKFRKHLRNGIKLQFNDDDSEEDEVENRESSEEVVQKPPTKPSIPPGFNAQTRNLAPRTPSEIPAAAVPVLHLLNAGRGLNPALRPSRIAANIYQGLNTSPEFAPVSSLASAGIGRGQCGVKSSQEKVHKKKEASLPSKGQMDDAEEDSSGLALQIKKMTCSNDKPEDIFKVKRKLEKKLKQIEILENKKTTDGIESLNEEEIKKLNSKFTIVEQLRKITEQKMTSS